MSPGPVVRDPSYGWVMVFAVFVLSALSFGALGSVSVFLKPLSTEFGWSRGETALATRSSHFRLPCSVFYGVISLIDTVVDTSASSLL